MENNDATDKLLEKMTNHRIADPYSCMELLNSVLNDSEGQILYTFHKKEFSNDKKWSIFLGFSYYNFRVNNHTYNDSVIDESLGRACLIAYLWIIGSLRQKIPLANNSIENFLVNAL